VGGLGKGRGEEGGGGTGRRLSGGHVPYFESAILFFFFSPTRRTLLHLFIFGRFISSPISGCTRVVVQYLALSPRFVAYLALQAGRVGDCHSFMLLVFVCFTGDGRNIATKSFGGG